jgi:hypothetical protein
VGLELGLDLAPGSFGALATFLGVSRAALELVQHDTKLFELPVQLGGGFFRPVAISLRLGSLGLVLCQLVFTLAQALLECALFFGAPLDLALQTNTETA